VRFGLATRSPKVSLEVYDINGAYVRFLAGGAHDAGTYSVEWDGRDEMQNPVPAGTYIVRLTTGSGISTQKLIVTR
jgi:flagellar hook assembly protein FlgD